MFKARGDSYALWANHAKAIGREADWLAWSEDEPCEQRDVADDLPADFGATPSCSTL